MKKTLFLFISLFILAYTYAQTNVPTADLLDIKFSVQKGAEDVSINPFAIEKGKGATVPIYDQSIKQYVSHYTINTSTTSTNYYKINYKGNEDFKSKLKKSFTLEVYIKTTSNEDVVPVGSMYSGGFGIQQVAKGGAMQLKLGHAPKDYAYVGSKIVYYDIPQYYHIVYTYDGNMLKAYYNGALTDNVTGGELRFASSASYHWIGIGGDVSASTSSVEKAFSGDIALVRMYSKALSNEEISALEEQIKNRKNLAEIDMLNNLVESRLARYITTETNAAKKNQAQQYMVEGRKMMQNMNTTAQDIYTFCSQVKSGLSIAVAPVNFYPRFAVMSDLHIGATYGWNDKITKAINILDTQNEPLDAVFVVGDITNGGTSAQYKSAQKVFAQMPSSTPVYFLMGNHDWLASSTASNNYFKDNLGQDQNHYFEIKGYPFILLSMNSSNQTSGYNKATQDYLRSALADASKNYPGKSIFLFTHIPETNTVYGSQDRGTTLFKDILKNYPQVVVFSGHSHFSIYDERSILQNNYTRIHDGGFAYTRMEVGNSGKVEPANSKEVAEGHVVSVQSNGDVSVKRMDFFRNEEIRQPWLLKAPHDGSQFIYTTARTGGDSPAFPANEKPIIAKKSSSAVNVTFPQATDDQLVHHYEVKLIDMKGAELKNFVVFPLFHLGSQQPAILTKEISPLYNYKGYKIRIIAVDSFGNESLPFDSDWFTAATGSINTENIYLTGSATVGGWTASKAEKMTPIAGQPGVYQWQGQLSADYFTFLFQTTATKPALIPPSTKTVKINTNYELVIDDNPKAYAFKISKKADYRITVDTNNWKVTVTDPMNPNALMRDDQGDDGNGSTAIDEMVNPDNYFTVIPDQKGVEVILKSNDIKINSIELIDMSGKIIAKVQSVNVSNTVGKNLVFGVYVLKINCDKATYTRKILIQ